MPKYYWDANVFLSIIIGEIDRIPTVNAILDDCENNHAEVHTSILSIAEVAFSEEEKTTKILDPDIEESINELWSPESPIKIVELYDRVIFTAKTYMRNAISEGFSLKPMDAIHLATASSITADEYNTYDKKLHKFSDMIGLRIKEPESDRLLFPVDIPEDRLFNSAREYYFAICNLLGEHPPKEMITFQYFPEEKQINQEEGRH